MVVSGHEEARRARSRVIDGLADLRGDDFHHGADDMARRAELAQFARLFYLLQDMLEQIALGVRIGPVEPKAIHQVDDLG